LAGALFLTRLHVVWLRFGYQHRLFRIPSAGAENRIVRAVMVEFLPALPVGTDGEYPVFLELGNRPLNLP
jgi:hypothetical protein